MGNRRLRRLKPIRGRLPPAELPEWIYHKGHEEPQRYTKHGPGAWRGMAGFARHALVLGSPPAQLRPIGPIRPICPTALSFWHVADVPGVQGELLPAGAWGSAPHPSINQSANQSKTFVSFVSFVISNYSGSPAGGSRPLIGSNRRNRRFPLRCALCVPLWFFVFFVGAAQRSTSSPPEAAVRAFTSVAPPSLQASKLPSFQKTILWRGWICYTSANAEEGG